MTIDHIRLPDTVSVPSAPHFDGRAEDFRGVEAGATEGNRIGASYVGISTASSIGFGSADGFEEEGVLNARVNSRDDYTLMLPDLAPTGVFGDFWAYHNAAIVGTGDGNENFFIECTVAADLTFGPSMFHETITPNTNPNFAQVGFRMGRVSVNPDDVSDVENFLCLQWSVQSSGAIFIPSVGPTDSSFGPSYTTAFERFGHLGEGTPEAFRYFWNLRLDAQLDTETLPVSWYYASADPYRMIPETPSLQTGDRVRLEIQGRGRDMIIKVYKNGTQIWQISGDYLVNPDQIPRFYTREEFDVPAYLSALEDTKPYWEVYAATPTGVEVVPFGEGGSDVADPSEWTTLLDDRVGFANISYSPAALPILAESMPLVIEEVPREHIILPPRTYIATKPRFRNVDTYTTLGGEFELLTTWPFEVTYEGVLTEIDEYPSAYESVEVDGVIYCFINGTKQIGGAEVAVFFSYDIASDTWTQMADLNTRRIQGSLVAWDSNTLYSFNTEFNSITTSRIYSYNIGADTWTLIASSPITELDLWAGRVFVLFDGEVWAIGGRHRDDVDELSYGTRTVDIYDPVGNSWRAGPDIPVHSDPYWNSGFAFGGACAFDGRLWYTGEYTLISTDGSSWTDHETEIPYPGLGVVDHDFGNVGPFVMDDDTFFLGPSKRPQFIDPNNLGASPVYGPNLIEQFNLNTASLSDYGICSDGTSVYFAGAQLPEAVSGGVPEDIYKFWRYTKP